jgi:L-alanine-DL-glutamate epimerase-like enolase superfamily enzyme
MPDSGPGPSPGAPPRLARVEAIHVRVPFRRPLLDATGEFTHRRSWLLRVVDRDGREGLGEAALNPVADDVTTGALAALMRELVPALAAGRPPEASELVAQGESGRAAMAAIDGALEALRRHDSQEGGAVTIPVSATIAFGGPDAAAEAAAQAIELGFETLKLRAGYERTTDQLVDRLRALRAAVGPEPRLRIDAGGAWDLATATERIAAIEPFGIEYVEQPLAAWDLTGHAALRERTHVPIALDEDIDSEGSARAALAEGAAAVLIVKPARVGGRDATLRIARAASDAGASVVLGTYFETGVGIAAVLRIAAALRQAAAGPTSMEAAHGLATAGLLAHDLLAEPLLIHKGRMAVPAAIALDESEVARYAIERLEALG